VAGLLMLADSRLPAGGHAHSGGVEAAVTAGWVRAVDDLAVFLRGRLRTAGAVAAGLAAAACADPAGCARLDAEADARMPSPAQRAASRQQGRALLRAARVAWPAGYLDRLAATPGGPHHAVALGAVAAAAGADPGGAAQVAAYLAVSGPAAAAVRLCGFDPLAVNAVLAAVAGELATVAAQAVAAVSAPAVAMAGPSLPAAGDEFPSNGVPAAAAGETSAAEPGGAEVGEDAITGGEVTTCNGVTTYGELPAAAVPSTAGSGTGSAAEFRGASVGSCVRLPAAAAPRLDLLAEVHARVEVRLFAS
jgi:urease accessory protein